MALSLFLRRGSHRIQSNMTGRVKIRVEKKARRGREWESRVSKDPNIMSFFEHLEELRKRIFRSLLILLVAFLGCWNYHRELYLFLSRPLTKFMKSEVNWPSPL